jgi:ribonuclease T1
VKTPGARDRGARRIVAGRGGEYYYTHDHYRTFRRIRE